jgi:flagellar motor switch protein FliM
MNKVVSQDELDVLLDSPTGAASRRPTEAYDFRRPERVTSEQMRALHLLHERFAQDLAMSLSAFLRSSIELRLDDVDQLTYGEFLSGLPDSTALYALAMAPLATFTTLEIGPDVAFTMIDRLLGGTGKNARPQRPLTEIEQNILDTVVKLLIDQLTEIWRGVAGTTFTIHARETRAQMLQVTGRSEVVVQLAFALKVADTHGMVKLCIPAAVIEAVRDTFITASKQTTPQRSEQQIAWLHANLGRVAVPVQVQLTTVLAASELVALSPGDVLSLGHQAHEPVAVSVGDISVLVGHLLVHNGTLAVRVKGEPAPAAEGTLS